MNGDRGTSHRASKACGQSPPRARWRFASSWLLVAAIVIALSSLRADDGPRNSTKKTATGDAAPPQQTAGDAHNNKNIASLVRLPNGDPVVGAEVVLYWDSARWDAKQFKLVFDQVSQNTRCSTDKAGRFQVATPSDDFWVVIAHPSGFLRRRFEPNTVPAVLELVPWGRVEGTLRVGRKLQPNTELSIQLENYDQHGPHAPWFGNSPNAKTDATGHFVFEHVVPGRARISKSGALTAGQRLSDSCAVYQIVVRPDQTTKIDLGTSGRPVIGQLRVPPNAKVAVTAGFAAIFAVADNPQSHEPLRFYTLLDDRGNFCLDDVPVGDYRMSVFIRARGRNYQLDQFTVPAINEKLSQRPVDLGILTLELRDGH
jgi:hypothetical protein